LNRAKKRFGQHFLHDPGTIDRILRAIAPRPGDRLVEIGPGRGAITVPLLDAAGSLDVVEIDRDVVPELERRCSGHGVLRVHLADALEFDFRALRGDGPRLRLVGNLPTTSRRRCCSTSSASSTPWPTCTSCCRRKWSPGWRPGPAARNTAVSR
jgi:16S rRNA A1518/A1519 N6-dimethyltransferase RsmA/KsgA/DIM1 with predicted DNA glycosylase/AP lyase activity